MKKITGVVVILLFLLTGCVSSKDKTIELNEEKISTITKVVGEKKIRGISKKTKNTEKEIALSYKKGTISKEELFKYCDYLVENEGFTYLLKLEGLSQTSTIQVSKEVTKSAEVIVIDAELPKGGQTVITYKIVAANK